MKIRGWWLGVVVLILLSGIGMIVVRFLNEEPGGKAAAASAKESPSPARKKTKRAHPEPETSDRSQPGLKPVSRASVMFREKMPELGDEQIERFLADSRRSAESLLAVYRMKHDPSLLEEAARAYPENSNVQLEMAMLGGSTEEKRQALERYRKLQPGNAMGDYLSALMNLQENHYEEAFKDLSAAASRPEFGVRDEAIVQSCEDAFRSAGYGLAEARSAAMFSQPRPQWLQFNQLAGKLSELHARYQQSGDTASADAIYQMEMGFAGRLRGKSGLLIDELVGLSIESRFLGQLPREDKVPGTHQTVAERIEAMNAERKQLSEASRDMVGTLSKLSENELLSYLNKVREDGERGAQAWLRENHGQ